jgi:hypothetical protein
MVANHHKEQDPFASDWTLTEGVEDAAFEFGPDRKFAATAPSEPSGCIKVRRSSPSRPQAILAIETATIQPSASDTVFTIWAETLGNDQWRPKAGDILVVKRRTITERWIIKTCQTAVYGTQYVCYCQESPLNQDTVR